MVKSETRTYSAAMAACSPIVRGWSRLAVDGLEHLLDHGPVLLAVNHDSYWDPVAVGVAALPRRQIRGSRSIDVADQGVEPHPRRNGADPDSNEERRTQQRLSAPSRSCARRMPRRLPGGHSQPRPRLAGSKRPRPHGRGRTRRFSYCAVRGEPPTSRASQSDTCSCALLPACRWRAHERRERRRSHRQADVRAPRGSRSLRRQTPARVQ